MKPAGASSSDADRSRTDDEKRALIQEYDEADYKGRYAVLDREQITIRHIGRWRTETRGANLRVAGGRTAPRPPRKPAPVQPAVAEPAPLPPAPEPAPAPKPAAAAKPAPVTKPVPVAKTVPVAKPVPAPKKAVAAKPAAVAPAAPKKAKPAPRSSRKAAAADPAPPRRAARSRRTATPLARTTPSVRTTPSTRPEPTSRRTKVAASEAPVEIPRRQRRRTAATDLAATALRDAALAHSDQIRQHAEALQKMVADDAWQTVTASAGPSAPDVDVLLEQIKVAERAAEILRDHLAATGVHAVPAKHSDPAAHRGRKPWWGATAD
jgi:hypothetical protein